MTVKEAQERIDSAEFAEWMALYSIDPFGEFRADIRIARLCCIVANALRGKSNKRFEIKDFVHIVENPKEVDESALATKFMAFQRQLEQKGLVVINEESDGTDIDPGSNNNGE